jgi:hypothetical protein
MLKKALVIIVLLLISAAPLKAQDVSLITIAVTQQKDKLIPLGQPSEATDSSDLYKSMKILDDRIAAAVRRVTVIGNKISGRLETIKKSNKNTANLNSQVSSVIQKISQLNIDTEKSRSLLSNITINKARTEYQNYRREQGAIVNSLKEIIILEQKIVSEMKKFQ